MDYNDHNDLNLPDLADLLEQYDVQSFEIADAERSKTDETKRLESRRQGKEGYVDKKNLVLEELKETYDEPKLRGEFLNYLSPVVAVLPCYNYVST